MVENRFTGSNLLSDLSVGAQRINLQVFDPVCFSQT